MEQAVGSIAVSLFFGFLLFILGIFITRWIFRIDTMVKYMSVQIALLVKMARNAGVSEEEIQKAIK